MSTRAGAIGLLTGLVATILIFVLYAVQPTAFLGTSSVDSAIVVWIAVVIIVLLITGGSWCAVRRSGSVIHWRCTTLGALAGALAGTVIFCLWGAAAAGQAGWFLPENSVMGVTVSRIELIDAVIKRTQAAFLMLFLGGAGLGALGGWFACPRQSNREDSFDKKDPQMVLNASITAVPASMLAVAAAAAVFKHLPEGVSETAANLPLFTALLLVMISHLALTLVVPHETGHATHRCGMDEIKMASYVGIVTGPVLLLVLIIANSESLWNPLVMISILVCSSMSLVNILLLVRMVLPRRASFPAPRDGGQKTEAVLFGTIAFSNAPRLVVLCTGCGLAMALPLYVSVLSVMVNLSHLQWNLEISWELFKAQALVNVGTSAAAVAALVLIYMFYLNLGRWWNKKGK